MHSKAATQVINCWQAAADPKQPVKTRGISGLNRKCPNCLNESISVPGLIVSNVDCTSCRQLVGVHWLFRAVFFVIILAVTAVTTIVVLADQGIYAALLMFSVPIGAIGFVKARFCPLELKRRRHEASTHSGDSR